MVNQFLRNSITVTLQWPREPGAVYRVNIMPEAPHTELTNHHNNVAVVMNLTISYNIQYNISIVASLCGVTITTTKILKYGRYENDSKNLHVPGDSIGSPISYNWNGKAGKSLRMRLAGK